MSVSYFFIFTVLVTKKSTHVCYFKRKKSLQKTAMTERSDRQETRFRSNNRVDNVAVMSLCLANELYSLLSSGFIIQRQNNKKNSTYILLFTCFMLSRICILITFSQFQLVFLSSNIQRVTLALLQQHGPRPLLSQTQDTCSSSLSLCYQCYRGQHHRLIMSDAEQVSSSSNMAPHEPKNYLGFDFSTQQVTNWMSVTLYGTLNTVIQQLL